MEPEFENLKLKSESIRDAIKNKNLTNLMLNDYMNDFNELSNDLKRKLYSLQNIHLHDIYTDDDIDCMKCN